MATCHVLELIAVSADPFVSLERSKVEWHWTGREVLSGRLMGERKRDIGRGPFWIKAWGRLMLVMEANSWLSGRTWCCHLLSIFRWDIKKCWIWGDISIFNSVVSFIIDCLTANFSHFLASVQLKFHIFAPRPAHTVNTHGYRHRSTRGGSPLMHDGGWGQRKDQTDCYSSSVPGEHHMSTLSTTYGLSGLHPHGADWKKDTGYQSLSQIQFRRVCLCVYSVRTDLSALCA